MDNEAKTNDEAMDLDIGKKIAEGPEIQNQETDFLDIPPSKNYTYDIHQFPFDESASMTGIFSFNSSGNPCFNFMRPHPKMTLPKPNFYSIPTPFTILSSADGLILCLDFVCFNYHLCNPFFQTPLSHRCLRRPSRLHDSGVLSVLATDAVESIAPIFYVICLVEQRHGGHGCFAIDAYSSLGDRWLPPRLSKLINVGARVVENSGIADSYGHAYWLTEAPYAIVRVGFTKDGEEVYEQIIDIGKCSPGAKMQLGRIRMDGICLVYSSHLDVQFYMLLDGEQDVTGFQFMSCLHKAEHGMIRDADIELVRFEKDAVLWVDGRVVFWQLTESCLHEMPRWVRVPDSVSDAIPYVYNEILPSEFLSEYPDAEYD